MAAGQCRAYCLAMINKILRSAGRTGLVSGAVLAAALTGCTKSQPDVQYAAAPAAPAPVVALATTTVVQPAVVVQQDDYVYYPAYEVYYSSSRHDYRYRDGNVWVTRASPPHVSVDVLFASPSVRLDFHDAPERHHEEIMRSYPKNWAPPGRGRDDRKDERKEKH